MKVSENVVVKSSVTVKKKETLMKESEKLVVKSKVTNKKKETLPDSSKYSKKSFLESQCKFEENLINSKNPLDCLGKKSVSIIEREIKSSKLHELGNRLLMIEKIDTNNTINSEELLLLMANLRYDMDVITLKHDMCFIKVDKNMDMLLAALFNDLTVQTMENSILQAKTICAKLLLPSLYNCYGDSKHNGSPAKVHSFEMILKNCVGDMSKLLNTILSLSKGRIISRLHREIKALKGRIPRP